MPGAGHGGSMHSMKVILMATIANKGLIMKTWILNNYQAHSQASWCTSSACQSIFTFVHPLTYPSTCLFIYTCMYLYIPLSIYTYRWMYLAIHQHTGIRHPESVNILMLLPSSHFTFGPKYLPGSSSEKQEDGVDWFLYDIPGGVSFAVPRL